LNFISRYIKELGIVFSYAIMLIACVFLNWEAFAIFISFLIEIVVLFLVYAFLQIKNPQEIADFFISIFHIIKVFIGMITLFLFHYFLIGFLVHMINPNFNILKDNLLLTKEVLYAAGSMLLLYVFNAYQISNYEEKIIAFQNKLIIQVLVLTISNIVAFIALFLLGLSSLFPILTSMVIARIIMELYFLNPLIKTEKHK